MKYKQNINLLTVSIELTLLCNESCSYCYNIKQSSYLPNNIEKSTGNILSIIDNVLSEFVLHQITLTGGEPLLHKDITKIVKYSYFINTYRLVGL